MSTCLCMLKATELTGAISYFSVWFVVELGLRKRGTDIACYAERER